MSKTAKITRQIKRYRECKFITTPISSAVIHEIDIKINEWYQQRGSERPYSLVLAFFGDVVADQRMNDARLFEVVKNYARDQ